MIEESLINEVQDSRELALIIVDPYNDFMSGGGKLYGRFTMEPGYHATVVTDATSAYDNHSVRTAHEVTVPTFAHRITSTALIVSELKSLAAAAV